ncbi:MAG: hypothetical protein UV35_C0012G0016 [candidate division WWE3 bacterium GW2011_GWB1_42_6]|uniref:Uncharacterized protein n=1 Tax=candidate division WWE3 bacterium GW2011_GWB1_42_6 TaxID=1619115 RepID=A0A0G1AZK8_UNCKA|nr:MAG: hypothetical protein UV35_C0012G0016 [candidate division WWE3 bacterium GW2011_GWB1_42_6]
MLILTLLITRFLRFFIKLCGLGSGGTWPGHFALKIYPGILSDPGIAPSLGTVLISGTNGKTTTTKMLHHVLQSKGFSVVTNPSGANLTNGLVSALLQGTPIFSKRRADYAVLEVDEFSLPSVLNQMRVEGVVLLNLSRDQLDRYGETDLILSRWEESLKESNVSFVVLDKSFDYFRNMLLPAGTQVLDLEVLALSDFQAAYGRGEIINSGGVNFHLFLAKNPASLTTNLNVFEKKKSDFGAVFFVLNDNIPDGRDVSWIYDTEASAIFSACKDMEIYVSGSRVYDMAVRLDYAGVFVPEENVSASVQSVTNLIKSKNSGKNVAVGF